MAAEVPDDPSEADPDLILAAFSASVNDVDSAEQVLEIAIRFAKNGVNIWRVIEENPKRANELLDVDVEPTKGMIEKTDRIVE